MTDTAQTEEVVEVAKPFLDLDAMLEDLHNGFPQEEAEVETRNRRKWHCRIAERTRR